MPTDPQNDPRNRRPSTAEEKAKAIEMRLLLDQIDRSLGSIQSLPVGINLYLPDGTPNYAAVLRVMRDPEFESFREQNPEVFRSAQVQVAQRIAGFTASTATDLAKLGFSLDQIRRAKRADDRLPPKLGQQPADQSLRDEITSLQQEIEVGMGETERRLADSDSDLAFRSSAAKGAEFSGGQAASAQAAARAAARTRQLEANRRASQSMAMRQQARARMPQLLQMRQQEINRNAMVDQFNQRTDEQRQQNMSLAKAELMRAGYTNLFGRADNIFSSLDALSQEFGPSMPGFVRPLQGIELEDPLAIGSEAQQQPLDGVFQNPILRMNTGAGLFAEQSDYPNIPSAYPNISGGQYADERYAPKVYPNIPGEYPNIEQSGRYSASQYQQQFPNIPREEFPNIPQTIRR